MVDDHDDVGTPDDDYIDWTDHDDAIGTFRIAMLIIIVFTIVILSVLI